ncbi:Organic cation transporter-like protein [Holothuria leucospilota]|uniref:Organic cation transporter-like protein n=1 Tax=Holothuria leucospilota TaxID=206669 RepID=A0A9Q1BID6_HOLLE|nr:Organic cation transporter-like protein [Holothuria leucospilota]
MLCQFSSLQEKNEDVKSSLKFDDILIKIGEFGRYQRRIYFLICLLGIPVASINLSQVFLAQPTDHWCAVKEWKTDVDECMELRSDKDEYYKCMYKFRNASIPIEMEDEVYSYSQCRKYDANYTSWDSDYFAGDTTNDTIECDEGWNYDTYEYKRTIITDFDLVCDQKTFVELAQSIYFVGVLVGSFFFGSLSDLVGRRLAVTFAAIFSAIFQAATALSPTFWAYTMFRFFVGSCNIGCFLLAFVMGTELVGPSKRVFTGIIIQCFYAVGCVLLTFFGYFIRDWRLLQVSLMSQVVLFWIILP